MDRLTKKLKKGGYSANKHTDEEIAERLEQLKGVHQHWVETGMDMVEGMRECQAAGEQGAMNLIMLRDAYNSIARVGKRFEAACPAENNPDTPLVSLGKLEDLYEQCVSELEDVKEGLEECRENGFTDDLAYDELMVTKLGISQLIKQFDIATGYAEPDPGPYQYQPKEDKPAE